MTNKDTFLQEFQDALKHTAQLAARAFENKSERLTRKSYFALETGPHLAGGSVYAFFLPNRACLYVGESGMALRKREEKHPTPLTAEIWWPEWEHVLVFLDADRPHRELFERLLVLAYSPKHLRHKPIIRTGKVDRKSDA